MKTLLIVDLQNDFMPGGALPVPDGDADRALDEMVQAGVRVLHSGRRMSSR